MAEIKKPAPKIEGCKVCGEPFTRLYVEPPTSCPNCGNDVLNNTDNTYEDELILRSYLCGHCRVRWTETFRFTGWEYD